MTVSAGVHIFELGSAHKAEVVWVMHMGLARRFLFHLLLLDGLELVADRLLRFLHLLLPKELLLIDRVLLGWLIGLRGEVSG